MHTTYTFDFLTTISHQLVEELDLLVATPLTANALEKLNEDQSACGTRQGVYVLFLEGMPVYLGKADNVHERLRQHLRKLSGRLNVDVSRLGYKALLLDKSISTAANEDVLIDLFRDNHEELWNGTGFGPKDPGRERDTTAPNKFDREFPIRADFPVETVADVETVGSLFHKMKRELPYVFRHGLTPEVGALAIDLRDVPRTAEALLTAAMAVMEPGWQAVILSHGMVVYKDNKAYAPEIRTIRSPWACPKFRVWGIA